MIGDVVRLWLRRHHLFALLESRAYYERIPIFFKPRNQLALDFKRRGSVRCAFFYVLERQGELANILKRQGHCIRLPASSFRDACILRRTDGVKELTRIW